MARQNPNRKLKRDAIFEWICRYADEHNGATPSIRALGRAFDVHYHTARAGHAVIEEAELVVGHKLNRDVERLL
jgi:DNA-binding transcriptional regulator YhcF (GntR family)